MSKKSVYEIWTYVYDTIYCCDEKKGRCHGIFKTKKQAEEALKRITKHRCGEPDSLFTDGEKIWRFKIVKLKFNKLEEYKDFSHPQYAVYNSEKKEWQYKDDDKVISILKPTKENIEIARRKMSGWYEEPDVPSEGIKEVEVQEELPW